jgi:hypothetical protein
MLTVLENFAYQNPVQAQTGPSPRKNHTRVGVGALVLQMLEVPVYELHLNWFEKLIESLQDQEAPIWREAHHFPEIGQVIL